MADKLIHTVHYSSPLGIIQLQEEEGQLTVASFINDSTITKTETTSSIVLKRAIEQLDEYFAGTRKQFDLPLHPSGTDFQQTVCSVLLSF